MREMKKLVRQAWRGIPHLRKEIAGKVSLRTRLTLTTPAAYYVIFGTRCNTRCSFCFYASNQSQGPELPSEVLLRLLRECKELSEGGFHISLSGGEPLIYRPLFDGLQLAQQLGVNLGFTTNGYLLTHENAKRVACYNPFNVNVSLESVNPQINEQLRPMKDGTKKTLAGIDNLLAEKHRTASRMNVVVKPTIMEHNYRSLPDLVRHFGKKKDVLILLQPYAGTGDSHFWVKDLESLDRIFDELLALQSEGYGLIGDARSFQEFLDYFRSPITEDDRGRLDLQKKKRYPCSVGVRIMTILGTGKVYFCDILNEIGDVYQHSLKDIWYSTVATERRQAVLRCNNNCQYTCTRKVPLMIKVTACLKM
jgi:MoaA/NifB/PqqE/SkfB family radical SAM enzyme